MVPRRITETVIQRALDALMALMRCLSRPEQTARIDGRAGTMVRSPLTKLRGSVLLWA